MADGRRQRQTTAGSSNEPTSRQPRAGRAITASSAAAPRAVPSAGGPEGREPERVTVAIDRVVAGGDGLGRLGDGRVVFVRGGLPGETVEALIERSQRDFARAQVAAIIAPSPLRVVPPCRHVADGCGGCSWQHIATPAQADFKVDIVADALRRIGRLTDPTVSAGPKLPGEALRSTVRLAVMPDGRVGFRSARSHAVVPVDRCLVARPEISALLPSLLAPGHSELVVRVGARTGDVAAWALGRPGDGHRPGGGRGRADGAVRADRRARGDRRGDGEGRGQREVAAGRDASDVTDTTDDFGEIVPPTTDGRRPSGLPATAAWGRSAAITEIVDGRRLRVSAGSFFQSSPEAAEALVACVRDAIGDVLADVDPDDGPVVDAFGGIGLFAATVVDDDHPVTVIDVAGPSTADARANLAGRPATVVTARVEDWRPESSPLVIADPARAGLGRRACDVLAATGCRRLVLVSCDAAALGRDTVLLAANGYAHQGSVVIDPFPHTPHVEVVSVFDRSKASKR